MLLVDIVLDTAVLVDLVQLLVDPGRRSNSLVPVPVVDKDL